MTLLLLAFPLIQDVAKRWQVACLAKKPDDGRRESPPHALERLDREPAADFHRGFPQSSRRSLSSSCRGSGRFSSSINER